MNKNKILSDFEKKSVITIFTPILVGYEISIKVMERNF